MRRRDVLSLLGGATVSWPVSARGQQGVMPVVGVLSARTPEIDAPLFEFFRLGLTQVGYVEGQNVAVEYRWASGEYDRLPALAMELIEHHVGVIVTFGGSLPAIAAKSSTATIPIVSATGNPVTFGLVPSLNRPNGNMTGVFTFFEEVVSKQLALICELVPEARKIGVLVNPVTPETKTVMREVLEAARTIGRAVEISKASSPEEIDASFDRMRSFGLDAALVGVDALFNAQRPRLVALAARHRLPTVFWRREFCDAGGLMCYGGNPKEAYVQVGVYTGRILKGASPAELPIVQSTTFELVINLKTAKALGLDVPPMLLARADEVIE
jgi:putative tryptophan/tyrosine transport system substrate-binding protein